MNDLGFELQKGTAPLLVSMPHAGTHLPGDLLAGYAARAREVEDTDWHLPRLYDFANEFGASILQPVVSRYVIDLNRPPDDTPMYPGASNTELCPTRFFTGDPLYEEGGAPDAAERERRRERYWQPYHDALADELARLREQHGYVLLWDAHSIRSEIPWLFEGVLPDLNIGTAGGTSADPSITHAVAMAAARHPRYSHVVNGRFKGGYITRNYGKPARRVHAVQLEMVQKTYMRETPPYEFLPERAVRVQPVLRDMVGAALTAAKALHAA
jgi:N-formylglutamate deformylase